MLLNSYQEIHTLLTEYEFMKPELKFTLNVDRFYPYYDIPQLITENKFQLLSDKIVKGGRDYIRIEEFKYDNWKIFINVLAKFGQQFKKIKILIPKL